MNIGVTGGSGFIGSHISKQLISDGHDVTSISRSPRTTNVARILEHKRYHPLSCDITDFEAVQSILHENKFDAIFHLAAHLLSDGDAPDPLPYLETNVRGTVNILQAAYLENVNKIIYSSSMNVYGLAKYLPVDENHPVEPINQYGLTKLMAEMYCRHYAQVYGFKIIILRYSGVFGPGRQGGAIFNFIDRALKNEPPIILSDEVWDTIYVKDVVTANMLALTKLDELGFEAFNIGIGEGIKVSDVANKIINFTGSKAKPMFGNTASYPAFFYDISKAKEVLRFTPTPFDESLKEYIELKKSQNLKEKKM